MARGRSYEVMAANVNSFRIRTNGLRGVPYEEISIHQLKPVYHILRYHIRPPCVVDERLAKVWDLRVKREVWRNIDNENWAMMGRGIWQPCDDIRGMINGDWRVGGRRRATS